MNEGPSTISSKGRFESDKIADLSFSLLKMNNFK